MMPERGSRKFHLLVVEDNPGDIALLRLALEDAQLDCELTLIDDGSDALAFIERRGKYADLPAPDLAILDLNVPKCDGLEILEAMRANRAFADVPVAVLSSSSSPRDRAQMEVFRIGRYITKPPDLDEYLKIGQIVKELLIHSTSSRTATETA
jgi:chemotaxis family two-component system response regulator Rcp1